MTVDDSILDESVRYVRRTVGVIERRPCCVFHINILHVKKLTKLASYTVSYDGWHQIDIRHGQIQLPKYLSRKRLCEKKKVA